MRAPIITSRLDNDLYNFTMGQVIWRHFRGVQVDYRLANRTPTIKLGQLIDPRQLLEQVEYARELRFRQAELSYLASLGLFQDDYLDWLATSQLPSVLVNSRQGELEVGYSGDWAEGVFWESPLLAIVSQLASEARSPGRAGELLAVARQRLEAKVARLAAHPRIKIVEFALRRRYSAAWQREEVAYLADSIPNQLLGTSNVLLAYELSLAPKGTMAHQMFMVTTALARAAGAANPIAASQKLVLDLFEDQYGHVANGQLLVFLPDTYGTETALRLLEPERAAYWAGMRQDSGNPFVQVRRLIEYYRTVGVDPLTKTIMPSDALDDRLMIELDAAFGHQTQLPFGLGTFLGNDTLLPPVSIVIKPIAADGVPCGKLTDNAAKAWGDPRTVALLKAEANRHTGIQT